MKKNEYHIRIIFFLKNYFKTNFYVLTELNIFTDFKSSYSNTHLDIYYKN